MFFEFWNLLSIQYSDISHNFVHSIPIWSVALKVNWPISLDTKTLFGVGIRPRLFFGPKVELCCKKKLKETQSGAFKRRPSKRQQPLQHSIHLTPSNVSRSILLNTPTPLKKLWKVSQKEIISSRCKWLPCFKCAHPPIPFDSLVTGLVGEGIPPSSPLSPLIYDQ